MDILITKDIQNSWIFQDSEKLKWWLDLVLMANENGEVHMSLSDLSHRWGTDKSKVSRFFKKLNGATILQHQMQHQVQRITICNTGSYKGVCNPKYNPQCNDFATPQEKSLFSPSPTPPTTLISKEIIDDNNAHAREENFDLKVGVLASEEGYIKRYQQEGLWADAAMSAHLTIPQVQQIFDEFVVEQKHNSSRHSDYSDFKRHFLNYLRVKAEILRKQTNGNGNNRPDYSRRGRADVPSDISVDF